MLAALVLAIPALGAAETVATVGGTTITREQLEKHVKPKLIEIENQRFEVLSDGLDDMISEQLIEIEAKGRKVSAEELITAEITSKVAEPTDAEVQKVYDENKAQLQGQTLEQVKPRIVEFLKQQKGAERQQAFISELKGKHKTTVALKPPKVAELTVRKVVAPPAALYVLYWTACGWAMRNVPPWTTVSPAATSTAMTLPGIGARMAPVDATPSWLPLRPVTSRSQRTTLACGQSALTCSAIFSVPAPR